MDLVLPSPPIARAVLDVRPRRLRRRALVLLGALGAGCALALALLPLVPGMGPRDGNALAAERPGLGCSAQPGRLRLCSVRTDNYKDCYNAPDTVRENRSWLNWHTVWARGATYGKLPGSPQFGQRVRVTRLRGSTRMPRRAFITVRPRTSGVSLVNLRVGPPSVLWGALLHLADPATLESQPEQVAIRLHATDGTVLARTVAQYRYDAGIASAAPGTLEANGPGGRWIVNGVATATDVELGSRQVCG